MVKGISRQVIVVQSPDPQLFEQAIFILKDEAVDQGVTDEALIKQAQRLLRGPMRSDRKRRIDMYGPVWACGGALLTALIWLVTAVI